MLLMWNTGAVSSLFDIKMVLRDKMHNDLMNYLDILLLYKICVI